MKKIIPILLIAFLAGCATQPRKTTYVQKYIRGWNGRWYKLGEKELCDSCIIVTIGDVKDFKGDTLKLYSVRR